MSYRPTFPDAGITPQWLFDELLRVSYEVQRPEFLLMKVHHEPIPKPQEGLVVCADGTDWNPGAGAGLYLFIGGVYTKL